MDNKFVIKTAFKTKINAARTSVRVQTPVTVSKRNININTV
jgi:hypothetical protein